MFSMKMIQGTVFASLQYNIFVVQAKKLFPDLVL